MVILIWLFYNNVTVQIIVRRRTIFIVFIFLISCRKVSLVLTVGTIWRVTVVGFKTSWLLLFVLLSSLWSLFVFLCLFWIFLFFWLSGLGTFQSLFLLGSSVRFTFPLKDLIDLFTEFSFVSPSSTLSAHCSLHYTVWWHIDLRSAIPAWWFFEFCTQCGGFFGAQHFLRICEECGKLIN